MLTKNRKSLIAWAAYCVALVWVASLWLTLLGVIREHELVHEGSHAIQLYTPVGRCDCTTEEPGCLPVCEMIENRDGCASARPGSDYFEELCR